MGEAFFFAGAVATPPRATSQAWAAAWPLAWATCVGVSPVVAGASILAPALTSISRASTLPHSAATKTMFLPALRALSTSQLVLALLLDLGRRRRRWRRLLGGRDLEHGELGADAPPRPQTALKTPRHRATPA